MGKIKDYKITKIRSGERARERERYKRESAREVIRERDERVLYLYICGLENKGNDKVFKFPYTVLW